MSKWKTIDTAPEGVELIVLRRDGVMCVAKVSGYTKKFGILNADFGNASCIFFFTVDGDYSSGDTPTHWMPLPDVENIND